MTYELWDLESGNRLATFRTESSAARYVVAIERRFGAEGLQGLNLGETTGPGGSWDDLGTGYPSLLRWATPRLPAPRTKPEVPDKPVKRVRELAL